MTGAASDAERVAGAFEVLGEGLFARLRGEFATAIFNRWTGALTVARDVCGIRPLFVHQHGGRTFIASEIRQTLAGSRAAARLDEDFVARTLAVGWGSEEGTSTSGVQRVVPGHVYTFDVGKGGGVSRRDPYWSPPQEGRDRAGSTDTFADELRDLLDRVVARALSPRQGAVALSGGMDSSTIWALARVLAREGDERARLVGAVSVAFPGMGCDESGLVREIVARTGGDLIDIDGTAAPPLEATERLLEIVEEPSFATLYLIQLITEGARANGKEVVYFGYGGDEWLHGTAHHLGDDLRRGHLARAVRDARAQLQARWWERLRLLARFALLPVNGLGRQGRRRLPAWLHRSRRASLPVPIAQHAGSRARQVLQGTLAMRRADRHMGNIELITASHGVELRCPLHDLDLIEFAFRTDGRVFTGGRRPKHLLRTAVGDLLPASVVQRGERTRFMQLVRREVADLAQRENVPAWDLVKRRIVEATVAERMRAEVAADERAGSLYTFMELAIAERFGRRFAS